MKALFLESKVAEECRKWAKFKQFDERQTEELLEQAYENGRAWFARREPGGIYDDYWVRRCLDNDKHKQIGLVSLFSWERSPEGDKFWRDICMRAM